MPQTCKPIFEFLEGLGPEFAQLTLFGSDITSDIINICRNFFENINLFSISQKADFRWTQFKFGNFCSKDDFNYFCANSLFHNEQQILRHFSFLPFFKKTRLFCQLFKKNWDFTYRIFNNMFFCKFVHVVDLFFILIGTFSLTLLFLNIWKIFSRCCF